ncbi:MAG: hypothetical protein R3C59_30435 [Planctomycetaceae bacterium]
MGIYNTRHRFFLSCAVAVALGAVFVVFRAVTSPFLDVERSQRTFSSSPRTENTSTTAQDEAREWFPLHPWVAEARKYFHDGDRFLYCGDFELINNDQSIAVSPIAMIWHSGSGKAPVTVVAESAQLTSSEVISPNSTDFGRITSGFIAGNVRIDGPGGLRIVGRTFHLAEDSMKLFSSDPVTFAWGTHRGTAEKGVDIYLQSEEGSSGGLTRISDVRQVRLNGRVKCDFHVPAARQGDDDMNVKVQAAGGFSFDMLTKTGTFSGLAPRSGDQQLKSAEEEVWVRRLNSDKTIDHLVCPELKLQFRNDIVPETGQPIEGSMKLEHIVAWGRRVLFRSEAHKVQVVGNEFRYALDERRMDIRHTTDASSPRPRFVEVTQGTNLLYVPHIRVLHSPAGGVQRLECNGRGIVRGQWASDDAVVQPEQAEESAAFEARWLESLVMQVGADQISRTVTLAGGAAVSESRRNFGVTAQSIALKLIPPATSGPATNVPAADVPHSGKVTQVSYGGDPVSPDPAADFDLSSLRPESIIATDNVVLKSAQATGQVRERLLIRFEEMLAGTTKQVSMETTKAAASGDSASSDAADDRLSFESDVLEAVVGLNNDPDNRQVEFRNVWLKGNVEIVRQSKKEADNFTATGNQLFAAGDPQSGLELKLFGDPAKLESQTRNLEGPRIDLNQLDNEFKVVGSGRIRFDTDKGFDGRRLPQVTPMYIYWSDHMVFQKRSADFVGNIRVEMSDGTTEDIELQCAGLTVYFSKDISLGQQSQDGDFSAVTTGGDGTEADPIERIECHNKVTVHIDQFVDGELNGRHLAEFADLNVNLITGDFDAVGPGFLESVSPDQDGQLQGPAPVTVRANTPSQTTETAFVYLRTEFIGSLNGNLKHREANLTQNVIALVAPARRVDEKISLQEVPTEQLPERAGILQAERLTVTASESGSDGEQFFELVARDNASLESRNLSASADVIQYVHQKQQFIIRAENNGTVVVNHRTGGKLDRVTGRRFQYLRRTNELTAHGVGSLNLTN